MLEDADLYLVYQPIFNFNGRLVGLESLLRKAGEDKTFPAKEWSKLDDTFHINVDIFLDNLKVLHEFAYYNFFVTQNINLSEIRQLIPLFEHLNVDTEIASRIKFEILESSIINIDKDNLKYLLSKELEFLVDDYPTDKSQEILDFFKKEGVDVWVKVANSCATLQIVSDLLKDNHKVILEGDTNIHIHSNHLYYQNYNLSVPLTLSDVRKYLNNHAGNIF
jgi:c-di-GMP-related signal transduction protein